MSARFDTSSIPSYVDALIAALERSAPTGVVVYDGDPASDRRSRDYVIVGDVLLGDGDQTWWTVGNYSRRETFTVAVEIAAESPGRDAATARARAYEILASVELTVRGANTLDANNNPDLSLGATSDGRQSVLFTSLVQPSHQMTQASEGRGCVITSGVRVTSDLTLIT